MKVTNHNRAEFGRIESEGNGRDTGITFHPRKDWPGYTAYELEKIAKTMRKLS